MTTLFFKLLPLALLPITACSLLPSAGPDKGDIDAQHQAAAPAFELIDLGNASLAAAQRRTLPGFASQFGSGSQPPARLIGVGDGLTVEIWEAGSDTLFSARAASSSGGARNASLSEQLVAADGSIHLPFAGRVMVAGLSPIAVEQKLTEALAGKASRPQVVVHVRNLSGTVTVVGDVAAGARVPLTSKGERVLDVLAAAGGVRAPSYETRIQLTRGTASLSQPLLRLLQDPAENIYLQAGDLIAATRQAQSFTAFGATGRNAQIEFGAETISLIEAVAKTGGLLDNRADPRGVYLFRSEPRAVVASLQGQAAAAGDEDVRVIYRLDLTQASSYFIAQQFAMRDRDIVYVSSAATNELQKFLELVGLVTQPVIQGAVIRGALK
ncbi:MAG: polysaccharide biosynthesis/export family protein [Pseudomonadota bacterium]